MAHRDVEEEIQRLNRLCDAPPAEAVPALRKALGDRVNLVAARAAKIAAELRLRDLVPDLLRAFDRLFEKPVERDPQCWGKNAISKALVALDHREAAPFLHGLRHIQLEPVWGGQEDTAATLRGTCALALPACEDIARGQVLRHLVDALADRAEPVRSDAARALAQMGGDEAILVLRAKARWGDPEAPVIGQIFDHLLQLERLEGLRFVAEFLAGGDEAVREEAALALGSSRLPEAVEALERAWNRERDPQFRMVVMRALSATRQPNALEFLLNLVRSGRETEAVAAVEALGLNRDSVEIRRHVEEAAGHREPTVRQQVRQSFARPENA